MSNNHKGLPKMALYLGYGGVLPFVVLSILSIVNYNTEALVGITVEMLLAIYAAVIISFLGAIHWGVVLAKVDHLSEGDSTKMLIYSIIPSLLAWLSFLLSVQYTLLFLGVLVLLCFLADYLLLFKSLDVVVKKSFARLRLNLSVVVSLCLLLAGFNYI